MSSHYYLEPTAVTVKCPHSNLEELAAPLNVQIIHCWNNRLTSIPEYRRLEELLCGNTGRSHETRPGYMWGNHIPKLPNFRKLGKLYCGNVGLNELPNCQYMEDLDCSDNNLTEIPPYSWLKRLFCGNIVGGSNRIPELIMYPLLETLDCPNAGIEVMPLYPNLKVINLTGNPIAESMDDPTSIVEYRRMATPRAKSARSAKRY